MSPCQKSTQCSSKPFKAVCFDFRGVILNHKTNKDIIPGMEQLLRRLKNRGLILALVSRFPAEVLEGMLGPIHRFFGSHIYSSGEQGKLVCIREFAKRCGIRNLAQIAFVDDKPDNIVSVARGSDVFAIGFRGSGKYPQARDICAEESIAYVENIGELEDLLILRTRKQVSGLTAGKECSTP